MKARDILVRWHAITLLTVPLLTAILGVVVVASSPAEANHGAPRAWQLPFDDLSGEYGVWISQPPGGERSHSNSWSIQDIDYDPTAEDPAVLAVADGVVRHIQQSESIPYGWAIRIAHSGGVDALYAHLLVDSIPGDVYPGAYVWAGKVIGEVGATAAEAEHLHFGARIGWTPNVMDSGAPVSILEMPGHWFRDCYEPPPDNTIPPDVSECDGTGLEWLDGVASRGPWEPTFQPPEWALRKLSPERSPLARNSFYAPFVIPDEVGFNMGANLGLGFNGTYFNLQKWDWGCNCWIVTDYPTDSVIEKAKIDAVDYYALFAISSTGFSPWSGATVAYGDGMYFAGQSHLVGLLNSPESEAVLEFSSVNAVSYNVWTDDGSDFVYVGKSPAIGEGNTGGNLGVPIQKGKCYWAIAQYDDLSWGDWSEMVCL